MPDSSIAIDTISAMPRSSIPWSLRAWKSLSSVPSLNATLRANRRTSFPHGFHCRRTLEIHTVEHLVHAHAEMLDEVGLMIIDAAGTVDLGRANQRNRVQKRLRQRSRGRLQALGQRPPPLEEFDIQGEETPGGGQKVGALGLADVVEDFRDLAIGEIGLDQLHLVHRSLRAPPAGRRLAPNVPSFAPL